MVRSYWMGPLFGALALGGLAQGLTPTAVAPVAAGDSNERYVTLGDVGKPGQKCRILKTWTMLNGNPAYQVQALDTGELMTVEESPSTGASHPKVMHIFRWGREAQASPHGTPEPPPNAVVLAQPFKPQPVAAAATEKAPGKWPAAFATKKPDETLVKPSASVAAAPAKKIEPAPLPHAPVAAKSVQPQPAAAKPVQPAAPTATKTVELTPLHTTPVLTKPAQLTPIVKAPEPKPSVTTVRQEGKGVPPVGSPYLAQSTPIVKAPEPKPLATTAKQEGQGVPPVGSPYLQSGAKPANPTLWSATTTWKPATPPAAPVKSADSPSVKKTITSVVKTDATPAQPGDWRESWGKIPPAKPGPIQLEARPATPATPKIDLPHAVVKADDPLSTPEKFAAMPAAGVFADAPVKETKKPLLAIFAPKATAPAPVSEEKKPERVVIVAPPPPPTPPAPAAVVEKEAPLVVKIPPPAPVTLPALPKAAPTEPTPAAAQVKADAKPEIPLGMQSVLAAQSPELAPPPPPKKPASPSQAQAMGVNANEGNAFSEPAARTTPAMASNGFRGSNAPAPAANPQAEVMGRRDASPVAQAGYRQEVSPELAQLSVVMHESVYPSQREWAAERLGTYDWRRQPQAVEVLLERAKQDPAPGVRAECIRSLVRMNCNEPEVTQALQTFKSDANSIVREAANEADRQ